MTNRPRRNESRAEWLIEKQMRAAEAPHWLIKAQASLERSLQNIHSPDEWEEDFLKDKCKLPEAPAARCPSTRLSGTTDASLLASLLLDLSKLLHDQPQPHMCAHDLIP
jgi:hypothetical protein